MSRPATLEDVEAICLGFPETWFGITWGDRPTYLVFHRVRDGERQGRGFVLYRAPHNTAVNPTTGELYDDLLVIRTANAADKAELVEDESTPFFTIPHFKGFNAVLVQQSRLGELSLDELTEVLTDAWRAVAPKKLVKTFDGALGA
jgi:hypothetical protein